MLFGSGWNSGLIGENRPGADLSLGGQGLCAVLGLVPLGCFRFQKLIDFIDNSVEPEYSERSMRHKWIAEFGRPRARQRSTAGDITKNIGVVPSVPVEVTV